MTRTDGARQVGLLAALLALWTLSVHAVLPGMGAVPAAAGQVICSLHGLQQRPPTPVTAAEDCCRRCLAADIALPETPRLSIARLGWAISAPDAAPALAASPGRIAPRPPGQGPPSV